MTIARDAEKFWSRVRKNDAPNGCWLWTGRVNPAFGYGEAGGFPGMKGAHRIAYALTHGSIPSGAKICHSCDANYAPRDITYRRCVRPDHLYAGDAASNSADAIRAGRVRYANRNVFDRPVHLSAEDARVAAYWLSTRQKLGLSRERLGGAVGISSHRLALIERGQAVPSAESWRLLAAVVGVDELEAHEACRAVFERSLSGNASHVPV